MCCIPALVLATLSDSKTMKDEELFSLISTRRQYYLDSMTLATLHFKLRLRRKRRTLLPQTTASLINGMLQINQEFHMSDSELGGTLLEDHASFTEPRILARIALSEAHSAHSAILEILDNNSCSFLFSIEGGSVITVDSSLVPITQYHLAIKTQGIKEKT